MNEKFLKMNRDWVDEHLEAYVDGDLSEADAERMRAVLDASPDLARELALARRIHEDLAAIPDYRCPPVVAREVFARTTERKRWWENLLPAPAWGFAGLAATVLLVAGLWLVLPKFTGEPEYIVIDGQRFTVEEIQQARAELELAMAYVDEMSNRINKELTPYVSGESVLKSVNTGLDRGATDAREALEKMYRDDS